MFNKTNNRRDFIKNSLIGGISIFLFPFSGISLNNQQPNLDLKIFLNSPTRLYNGKFCWFGPMAGIVPGAGIGKNPRILVTMSTLDLSGSDVFKGRYYFYSDDFGLTWTNPKYIATLGTRYEMIEGQLCPIAAADMVPKWHKGSNTLLSIGKKNIYSPEWVLQKPPKRPVYPVYTKYNPYRDDWNNWEGLKLPDETKFVNAVTGFHQRYDLPDGNILLPISINPPGSNQSVTVANCSFDGVSMQFQSHGTVINYNDETRGLSEPSLTFFNDEYFLTIRHDKMAFITKSKDGLNYAPIKSWTFDDGSDLGNYNTQQHWVTHSEGLFLVYTRRGANNDHIMRHRAPLFMAKVDPERLCVIRETEIILVPERGARLGNFGITDVSPYETWVTVAENMNKGPENMTQLGADGSIFIASINWNKPNLFFNP
jgi:hypothetical protein